MTTVADALGATGQVQAAAPRYVQRGGTTPRQDLLIALALAAEIECWVEMTRGRVGLGAPLSEVVRYIKGANTGLAGNALEYTIHFAIGSRDPDVLPAVVDAMRYIGMDVETPQSVMTLFQRGERAASALIETMKTTVASDAVIVNRARGPNPWFNEARLDLLWESFRDPDTCSLPPTIRALGKADLLLGNDDGTQWAGAQVKSRLTALEPQPGVTIAIALHDPSAGLRDIAGMGVVDVGRWDDLRRFRDDAHLVIRRFREHVVEGGGLSHSTPDTWVRALVRMDGEPADAVAAELRERAGVPAELVTITSDPVTARTLHKPTSDEIELITGVRN